MRKFTIFLLTLFLTGTSVFASGIDRAIANSNINRNAVSVSVKDAETGKIIYQLNAKKPVTPASTLKIVTLSASLNELGYNYLFRTVLYKNTNNELILKLGADPFLTSRDLRKLFYTAKDKNINEPKKISIDDSILDKNEWGEGWQWDDSLNPLMPKFGAYNIDNNLLKISIYPTTIGAPAEIKLDTFYPITFMNLVTTTTDSTDIKISGNNSISPDILNVEGTIAKYYEHEIPINHPKRYFMLRLEDAIRASKINYYNPINSAILPDKNIYVVDTIENTIEDAIDEIMLNSNNMIAETVFKIAGGHYSGTTGTAENAILMLKDYCKKLDVNTDDIKVVDGSGVSKNNLVTADFMTSFLNAEYRIHPDFISNFATAGKGTLQNRMLYFGEKLRAKTGTLSDVSAIAGYITTERNKTYAFDIMINDAKSKPADKKMLEEYILRAIQTSY